MARSKHSRKTIKYWTAQDIKQLKQMARQKILARAIAKKLRRTTAAVYTKAHEQGISLKK
jgi:hypothetical protein